MQLGIRLTAIDKMVTQHYAHIWDCCCDHGLLGMNLLARSAGQHLHFVDIAAPLIEKLNTQLQTYFGSPEFAGRFTTYCCDVSQLPALPLCFNESSHESSNLVILAGVGGELTLEMVMAIINKNKKTSIEFLLCPVHHHFALRQGLIEQGCELVSEKLINENGRFYELIHVKYRQGCSEPKQPISAVGSEMWNFDVAAHQQYLNETIAHYQRKQRNPKASMSHIIEQYQQLKPTN